MRDDTKNGCVADCNKRGLWKSRYCFDSFSMFANYCSPLTLHIPPRIDGVYKALLFFLFQREMDALDQIENCTIPDCPENDENDGGNTVKKAFLQMS